MKRRMLGALALLATIGLPASATTEASLSLSNFSIALKDLNQADGISPSLSWDSGTFGVSSDDDTQLGWGESYGNSWPIWSSNSYLFNMTATPGSMDGVSLLGHGTQHISTSGVGVDALMVAAHAEAGQAIDSTAFLNQNFTLTAGTQATFSVTIDGNWRTDAPQGQPPAPGWMSDLAYADVKVDMYANNSGMTVNGNGRSLWPDLADPFDSSIDGQVLRLTVKNTSAFDKTYLFSLGGSVRVDETALPVPEPSSYAMLAAGLLVLGGVARRRRS